MALETRIKDTRYDNVYLYLSKPMESPKYLVPVGDATFDGKGVNSKAYERLPGT